MSYVNQLKLLLGKYYKAIMKYLGLLKEETQTHEGQNKFFERLDRFVQGSKTQFNHVKKWLGMAGALIAGKAINIAGLLRTNRAVMEKFLTQTARMPLWLVRGLEYYALAWLVMTVMFTFIVYLRPAKRFEGYISKFTLFNMFLQANVSKSIQNKEIPQANLERNEGYPNPINQWIRSLEFAKQIKKPYVFEYRNKRYSIVNNTLKYAQCLLNQAQKTNNPVKFLLGVQIANKDWNSAEEDKREALLAAKKACGVLFWPTIGNIGKKVALLPFKVAHIIVNSFRSTKKKSNA